MIDEGAQILGAAVRDSVCRHGIFLTGGGVKLKGLESFLRKQTGFSFVVQTNPQDTAIRGLERLEVHG